MNSAEMRNCYNKGSQPKEPRIHRGRQMMHPSALLSWGIQKYRAIAGITGDRLQIESRREMARPMLFLVVGHYGTHVIVHYGDFCVPLFTISTSICHYLMRR